MESEKPDAECRRRHSIHEPPDLRLVVVGKTGSGKSSSANTILGKLTFAATVGQLSVTRQCCKQTGEVFGRQVTVVDTPGLFDTSLPKPTVEREIAKCINMSAPGPHAILLVIKVGPFTNEEQLAVQQVEEIFGPDAWKYTIILFTYGDRVESDFAEVLRKAGPELQAVLSRAGNRYHVFNNLRANDRGQVLDLLEKVEGMVSHNEGQFYSNYTYVQVVQMLDEWEKKLREVYKEKLEEGIRAVESKYKRELSEAHQEHQRVERRLQSEVMELKRYYHALESGVRHVVEQTLRIDSMEDIHKFHQLLKLN